MPLAITYANTATFRGAQKSGRHTFLAHPSTLFVFAVLKLYSIMTRQELVDSSAPLLEQGGANSDATATAKKRNKFFYACLPILGCEFCERLTYYGVTANLMVYLTNVMGKGDKAAAVVVSNFQGLCYLTPLLGGWLADAWLNRFRTIAWSAILYALVRIYGSMEFPTSVCTSMRDLQFKLPRCMHSLF